MDYPLRMPLHPDDRLPETPGTRHRDYILTAYPPRVSPVGRLHNATLLRWAMREHQLEAWPLLERLRQLLGEDETVWGLKLGPAGFSVELYFYNFTANAPGNPASATRVAAALAPTLRFPAPVDERLPYFMCSFELDSQALRTGVAPAWRLYLGSGDRGRTQCGFSYRVEPGGLVAENHYWFYKMAEAADRDDAARRVAASPRAGDGEGLMPAPLLDCYTVCFAVKPNADGLYFSRISSPQLADWLAPRHAPLAELLREDSFAHLSWDLGYDFHARPGERPQLHKFAIHGVL